MEVELSARANKYLMRLDASTRQRITDALIALSSDPPQGDIKKLRTSVRHRLRVGDYRVIFGITDGKIVVDKIGPRGDVYKGGGWR